MQLPIEIQHAEVVDWWEASQGHITSALADRLPALFYHVDKVVDEMSARELIRRDKVRTEKIEPIIVEWVEKQYRELTHELEESFLDSTHEIEDEACNDNWSYNDMATAGAAIIASAAPVAGIPFFAGGLLPTGLLGISFWALECWRWVQL